MAYATSSELVPWRVSNGSIHKQFDPLTTRAASHDVVVCLPFRAVPLNGVWTLHHCAFLLPGASPPPVICLHDCFVFHRNSSWQKKTPLHHDAVAAASTARFVWATLLASSRCFHGFDASRRCRPTWLVACLLASILVCAVHAHGNYTCWYFWLSLSIAVVRRHINVFVTWHPPIQVP